MIKKKCTSKINKPKWVKYKPYLHLTDKISLDSKDKIYKLINELSKEDKIEQHAFSPLIYREINSRRISKIESYETSKQHHKFSYKNKPRPIHYATHIDAHIYAKYGNDLLKKYEQFIKDNNLFPSITGYRSIKNEKYDKKLNPTIPKNKNSVLFAKELFEEIKNRGDGCVILTFDIEKFFSSLNHQHLKKSWLRFAPRNSQNNEQLRNDHYNVFKSVVNFHYIKLDDLRMRNGGFDEKKLNQIKEEENGRSAFFASFHEFRSFIRKDKIRVYKNQYIKDRLKCGIPQGLPISSTLSNLYMLEFDEWVYKNLSINNIFYRRYSDDIILLCEKDNYLDIEVKVKKQITEKCKLKISESKTEVFFYEEGKIKKQNATDCKESPFRYLGLEFDGKNARIKTASISKFYRRMKRAIKAKERMILRLRERGEENPKIFKNQLYKSFYRAGKESNKGKKRKYGNFLNHIKRTSEQMEDIGKEAINNQIRNHEKIFLRELEKLEKRLDEK